MKVVQFTIPVTTENSIHLQEDELPYFYEHLHRHNETQITWVIRGEGTFIAGNYMQRFQDGDFFVIGANQPHLFKSDPNYFSNSSSKQVQSLSIYFDPRGFLAHLLSFPELRSIRNFIELSKHGVKAAAADKPLLVATLSKIRDSSSGFRLAAFIEMLQVMSDMKTWEHLSTESFQHTITDLEGLRMNDIYQYTMANFTENISLERIAAVIHLTPQSFCRYFKNTRLKHILFSSTKCGSMRPASDSWKKISRALQPLPTRPALTTWSHSTAYSKALRARLHGILSRHTTM